MNSILTAMSQLKATVPELTLYSGMGHCVYGSVLLSQELNKQGIDNRLLLGETFTHHPAAAKCKAHAAEVVQSITHKDGVFSKVKSNYIKRGSIPNRIGHMVVLVDYTVYDITSGQFGLSETYTLEAFRRIWKTINEATVKLNNDTESFFVANINRRPLVMGTLARESLLCKWMTS